MNTEYLNRAVRRARERGIVIPTFAELRDPSRIPESTRKRLAGIGMQDVHPLNLFRITWKNDVHTGLFGDVNSLEFPSELTGVPCRIVGLVGRHFPTGAHKVGAAFGCLVPRLVSGAFDPTSQKAVWPSTGNFCRGGAFDCALLGCRAVAILPEGMSRERFEWLHSIGAEIIATPGSESNVKEIYDKCREIRQSRQDHVILNQFDEFGNSVWHYHVTGGAIEEVFQRVKNRGERLAGFVSATGSAGTIAAGDYLKAKYPWVTVAAAESLECPTLLRNGFGTHQIEGIGDKHVPWIHNVRNTDIVVAVHDGLCLRLLRLFNEDDGRAFLLEAGIPPECVESLPLLGISGIANLIASIKVAKYYELDERDLLFTVLTDSAELYQSRLVELRERHGPYGRRSAELDWLAGLLGVGTDSMRELGYYDRKALHNLKYFTWVEQQGKSVEDLNRLWTREFWDATYSQVEEWDERICAFNERVRSGM